MVPAVERWMKRPRTTWLWRAVFQLHLWMGLALGIYLAVVCASGSAIVFRNDFYDLFESWTKAGPAPWQKHVMSAGYSAMTWLTDLHGSLMLGPEGMVANGVGGFLTGVVCLSGLVVWWPGMASWRRGLFIKWGVRGGGGWKRFIFDLHRATGFWAFGMLLMWGLTGAYFIYPQPFRAVINTFTPIVDQRIGQIVSAGRGAAATPTNVAPRPRRRRAPLTPGAKILQGFSLAHEGTFGGWLIKMIWFVFGLAPVVLMVTSLLMWWNRAEAGPDANANQRRRARGCSLMTADDFRRLALSLPGALEGSHMGNPDFRVNGGNFATLALASQGYGMVQFTPEQQNGMVEDAPDVFSPVPGGWGRGGSTRVHLARVSEDVLAAALRAAWQTRMAKSVRKPLKRKPV
jgi:uncharacterized iron-regulated membrane protein